MLSREVTTKGGVTKTIMADNPEELEQAVRAAEAEEAKTQPDINNPEDGNKVVSPDNIHTDAQGGGQVVQEAEQAEEQSEQPQEEVEEVSEPQEVPQTGEVAPTAEEVPETSEEQPQETPSV